MEGGGQADAVSQALQQLQDALETAASTAPAALLQDLNAKLSQLSIHMHVLLQRHAVLGQSYADRTISDKAFRNVISNKQAETARLHSEITRLRHHLQLVSNADSQQQQQQGPSEQEAAAAPDPAAREAVLVSAIAAKDKPMAVVAQLESEVQACQARINSLESELAVAAADNSTRLAEQQKSFIAKLEQLRQVHSQQLTAATQASQAEAQQFKDSSRILEQQLQQANKQAQQQQESVTYLQQQVQELQQKLQQLKQSQPKHEASAGATSAANMSSKSQQQPSCNTSGTQLICSKPTKDSAAPAAAQNSGADAAALQLMEGQLGRLSGIIKSHQIEIAQLRQTVMEGSAERQQLQQQIQELQQQQAQKQTAGLPGAVQAAKLSSGAGSPSHSPLKKTPSSSTMSGGIQAARKVASCGR